MVDSGFEFEDVSPNSSIPIPDNKPVSDVSFDSPNASTDA